MSNDEFKFKETELSEQAWEAFCYKHVDLAKKKAQEAIDANSRPATAMRYMSKFYRAEDNLNEAAKYLVMAIETDENDTRSYMQYAEVLSLLKDRDAALEQIKLGIEAGSRSDFPVHSPNDFKQAVKDSHFFEWLTDDPELIELVATAADRLDDDSKYVWQYIYDKDQPYRAWKQAERYLESSTGDPENLKSLQLTALTRIISDLEEHGEENLHLYGRGKLKLEDYQKLAKKLTDEGVEKFNNGDEDEDDED